MKVDRKRGFLQDDIIRAFSVLKREVYSQRQNLFLRQKLAAFQSDKAFRESLDRVLTVANSDSPANHQICQEWLERIGFVVLPKSFGSRSQSEGITIRKFFSNKPTAERYIVEKVNYFFDGPIELHIISALWLLKEGRLLDQSLSKNCMGNRLHNSVISAQRAVPRLFRGYAPQYAMWRDGAVTCARRTLEEDHQNICILSLDIRAFYYTLNPSFDDIRSFIMQSQSEADPHEPSHDPISCKLLDVVEAICRTYKDVLGANLQESHPDASQSIGVPLDIYFAPVIANWCLREFDQLVLKKVAPLYYARYVDDILLVLPVYEHLGEDPVEQIISSRFVETGVLRRDSNDQLVVAGHETLRIGNDKSVLHYFSEEGSLAALDNFVKRISQKSSEFRELPDEGLDRPFKEVAWELQYDDSEYKWRSITGIAEDKNELARYLHKSCVVALFTDWIDENEMNSDLEKFFQGRNALQYFDLWERLFTFLGLTEQPKALNRICSKLLTAIEAMSYRELSEDYQFNHEEPRKKLTKQLKDSLRMNLRLALSMAATVSGPKFAANADVGPIEEFEGQFRATQMERHYFNRSISQSLASGRQPPEFYPRIVLIEECMIAAFLPAIDQLDTKAGLEWAKKTYLEINGFNCDEIEIEELNLGEHHK